MYLGGQMRSTQDKKTAFLFSAYECENRKLDEQNHKNLVGSLNRTSPPFPFKVVERVHTFNHDINETIPLIFIQVNEECQRSELFEYVKTLCISHNQQSFLEITPSREIISHSTKGKSQARRNGGHKDLFYSQEVEEEALYS